MTISKMLIIILGLGIWQFIFADYGLKLKKPCIFMPIISTIALLQWQPFFCKGSLSEFILILVVGSTLSFISMVITNHFQKET